ncbi:hypothetical protein PUN28_017363 [Cardiocondyla obscurior]|uniref:Uncharacterized protein n=1 Tax=Cardiocondyla obscurior TaxID=286306 RepID=A0AAW2EN37_9HYME
MQILRSRWTERIIGANSGSLYSSRQIRQFNAGENAGWTIGEGVRGLQVSRLRSSYDPRSRPSIRINIRFPEEPLFSRRSTRPALPRDVARTRRRTKFSLTLNGSQTVPRQSFFYYTLSLSDIIFLYFIFYACTIRICRREKLSPRL